MLYFSYLFSYWIVVWYVLYMVGMIPYNPKFALTVGLLENVILLFTMIYYKNKWVNIVLFCTVGLFMKVIPLWTLRHTVYTKQQVLATLVLFMVYASYLVLNGKNVISILKKNYQAVQQGTFIGPMSLLLKRGQRPRHASYHTSIISSSTAR